jgi:peroxiredoxin (alkyl hydroperoxide reductase subunit C)
MGVTVGQPVPDIKAMSWVRGASGPKRLSLAQYRGSWLVLFFYARDFTYICPTEIATFADLQDRFAAAGASIVGASTDSYFSHETWFGQDKRLDHVRFPIIADTSHQLSESFGVLLEDGSALRGSFIIDPDGILRHMSVTDLEVARNVPEILRVLQALQSGELCPSGWVPGQESEFTYNEWLAKVFPRLKKSQLAEISLRLQPAVYEAGDIIFRQGTKADRFYIIAAGEVSVIHRTSKGDEVELARLGAGEVFGEMGILTETRRSADVRADTAVSLFALDWEDFKEVIERSDPTARDFMEIVAQRRAALPGATV